MLFVPNGWRKEDAGSKRYPVILHLHGAGGINSERGVRERFWTGIGRRARGLPFIVVLPVASPGPPMLGWHRGTCLESCMDLLEVVTADLGGDPRRISAMGESMGGGGVWALVGTHPERFAAVVAFAGHLCCDAEKTGQKELVFTNLRSKPIWVFHSEDDKVAPVEEADKAVEILTRPGQGGDLIRFTRYTTAGHSCWNTAYDDEALYAWLLEQHLP